MRLEVWRSAKNDALHEILNELAAAADSSEEKLAKLAQSSQDGGARQLRLTLARLAKGEMLAMLEAWRTAKNVAIRQQMSDNVNSNMIDTIFGLQAEFSKLVADVSLAL